MQLNPNNDDHNAGSERGASSTPEPPHSHGVRSRGWGGGSASSVAAAGERGTASPPYVWHVGRLSCPSATASTPAQSHTSAVGSPVGALPAARGTGDGLPRTSSSRTPLWGSPLQYTRQQSFGPPDVAVTAERGAAGSPPTLPVPVGAGLPSASPCCRPSAEGRAPPPHVGSGSALSLTAPSRSPRPELLSTPTDYGSLSPTLGPPRAGGGSCLSPALRWSLCAFFAMNALLAFLFAWMLRGDHAAFAVAVRRHKWKPEEKAQAIFFAGLYNAFAVALVLLADPLGWAVGHARRGCVRLSRLSAPLWRGVGRCAGAVLRRLRRGRRRGAAHLSSRGSERESEGEGGGWRPFARLPRYRHNDAGGSVEESRGLLPSSEMSRTAAQRLVIKQRRPGVSPPMRRGGGD